MRQPLLLIVPLAFLFGLHCSEWKPNSGSLQRSSQGLTFDLDAGIATLLNNNYLVNPGTFYVDLACTQPTTNCNFNNPTTPYGHFRLPLDPYGTGGGTDTQWELNPGEAAVLIALTPPPAAYFAFTPYAMSFPLPDGGTATVFASVNDSLNVRTIQTAGGAGTGVDGGNGNVFGQWTLIALTTDLTTYDAVVSAFSDAGLPISAMNLLALGKDAGVPLGMLDGGSFSVLFRIALPSDAGAETDWEDGGFQATLLRVSPKSRTQYLSDTLLGVPALLPPQAVTLETGGLDAGFAALEQQLIALGADGGPYLASPNAGYGFDCIAAQSDCYGDNRDAIYSSPKGVSLHFNEHGGDYFVVYGVNHWVTGNTVYTNVDVTNVVDKVGIAAFSNTSLEGSAAQFLNGGPYEGLQANYYVYAFARPHTCKTVPGALSGYCYEVQYPAKKTWPYLPDGGEISFTERAYLNPVLTPTRPDAGALLLPRVLHIVP
jgi:hypothetical protein